MKEKILSLLKEIANLDGTNTEECRLPQNTYYLNDDEILCLERKYGESRYPYEMDGMTVWAHSTGYIDACESLLTFFRTASLKEEPCIEFWGGLKADENYFPISVLGPCRQLFEDRNVKRYTVFSKRAAFYITDTEDIIFAARVSVTSKKQIYFKLMAVNKSKKEQEIYLISYLEPHLRFSNEDNFWGQLTRYGKKYNHGSYVISTEQGIKNFAVINTNISGKSFKIESAVAKGVFLGVRGRNITNAEVLKTAHFEKEVYAVNTTDLPIASDIIRCSIGPQENISVDYLISFTHDEKEALDWSERKIDVFGLEQDIERQIQNEHKRLAGIDLYFGEMNVGKIHHNVFNRFLKNVQKQVDFCALGKNYAGDLIGVRDVFQQLESALMWNPNGAKEKMVTALNFLMINGRAPRQFSVPPKEGIMPRFDIRQFIDQGLWIISALYTYISFTDDYTILDEKCSYYEIVDEPSRQFKKSGHIDTVLEHLLKIMEYLISNIDGETKCLKILYGDWNDAVCGLGKTENDTEFGTGVSVMATLQLYQALKQMHDLLIHINKYTEKCEIYAKCRQNIENGLANYAVEKDKYGNRHIIHGWGDKRSYLVGSLQDNDSQCRFSATPNAFWCISDMIRNDISIKKDILNAFDALDSKYGIRTFDPPFANDMHGVGRITKLTPGTYENGCSYVHGTMFAAMALFIMGEAEKAWEQIVKAIVITHENATLTPFVMPNSYCLNKEYHMDGESMGDWFTGSGTVLIRNIVKYVFGIQPDLDGLKIAVPAYIPAENISIAIKIKQAAVKLSYKNTHCGNRRYYVNSIEKKADTDEISQNKIIFLNNSELNDELRIEIID